jgi:hypothetical protein
MEVVMKNNNLIIYVFLFFCGIELLKRVACIGSQLAII